MDYKSERSGRTFATLWLTEAPAESVNKLLAGRGLGRVVPAEQGKAGSDVSVTQVCKSLSPPTSHTRAFD